ncbi:MAG: DUF5916 domain-containing protein [Bacteroidales bacterium]
MRTLTISMLLAVCFSFITAHSHAQSEDTIQKAPGLRIYHTIRLSTDKPIIDGVLNDPCWQTGEWTGDFIQWIPNEGAKPSQDTRVKILYDNKNLYVAIRCFDKEPGKISRKAGRRDEMTGDITGINFDSYHDHRTGFEFSVTAAGQKIDLLLTNPMDGDMNWNAVWYVKTGMEDSAWVAEYEIPLSQLRYSKENNQVWGMHVWRWIDRLSEESDWEKQSLSGPGMLYSFGELRGIEGLPRSKRIEIMPYAVGKLKTFEKQPLNPFADKGRQWLGNVGLDAKIGLSSNFTADLTVNPDFGQVESDPSVMNLTAFETFYEEKRPFFLEGKNIFNFDMGDDGIFYSRRIGQTPDYRFDNTDNRFVQYPDNTSILSAVKISGKSAKGLAVGVLHSITAGEKAQLWSDGQTTEKRVTPLTSYTVGRLQQDFHEGNTVLGAMVTSTNRFIKDTYLEDMNRNAFTGGVDFLHQWNDKEFFVDARLMGSSINGSYAALERAVNSSARYYQRPDIGHNVSRSSWADHLDGHGGRIKIGKGSKGLLRYSTEIDWKSPGLELNDVGFMQMADIVHQETELSYFVTKPVSIFRTYTVGLHQNNQWDYHMNYENSSVYAFASMEFLNRWALNPSGSYQTQILDTRLLRGGPAFLLPALWEGSLSMHTDMSKKVHFSLAGNRSVAEDDNYTATAYHASVTAIPYNVLKVSLSLDYSQNQDNLQYVGRVMVNGFGNYLLAHLDQKTLGTTFRVDYNITPEISIQYYGSPFTSTGKYTDFKIVNDPAAKNYKDRFTPFTLTRLGNNYNAIYGGGYGYGYGGGYGYGSYYEVPQIQNPDFTFTQFRSNLVFRWEYRPGSQLFLVWANERTGYKNDNTPHVGDGISQLREVFPNNIFLVKLNYWFSL